ncbi:hypothetical protein PG993_011209 [Apiospora rasikravindrae]|uniref:Uncharacterized protein n=1 Tax=Apiospora rasikravindrae TaxID=990691 RepID=A0ABR1SDK7_9PEZI
MAAPILLGSGMGAACAVEAELTVREAVEALFDEVLEEEHALLGDLVFVHVRHEVVGGRGLGEGDVLFQGVAVPGCDVFAVVAEGFEDLGPIYELQ